MVTESAVLLAGLCVSLGGNLTSHLRLQRLEKNDKIKTFEITALEVVVTASAVVGAIDKYRAKQELKGYKFDINSRLNDMDARIANMDAIINAINITNQNTEINSKIDQLATAVDIALCDVDKK